MWWRRIVLTGLLLAGCGELDNRPIIWVLEDAKSGLEAAESCVPEHGLGPITPVLSVGTVGVSYVGFLPATPQDGESVEWVALSALPAGLALDRETGSIGGRPTLPGVTRVELEAVSVECPQSALSFDAEIQVVDRCADEDCPELDCAAAAAGPLLVDVTVLNTQGTPEAIPAAGWAFDKLKLESHRLRPSGSHTTHRMLFSVPKSKRQVLVDYTLPGGPGLPLATDKVRDMRYVIGDHGGRYFFLSGGGNVVFNIYDGHLPAAELAQRCPENHPGGRCVTHDYVVLPMSCESTDACENHQTLALDVAFNDADGLMLPSDSVEEFNVVTRLVRAFEPVYGGCPGDGAAPYRVSFYQYRTGLCAVPEAEVLQAPGPAAPTSARLNGRVLPPFQDHALGCAWTFVLPDRDAPVSKWATTDTDAWLEMAIVGVYEAQVTCESGCPDPARIHLAVGMKSKARVELFWTGAAGADDVTLMVAGGVAASAGGRVLAIDLDAAPPLDTVEVTYRGSNPIHAVVRVLEQGVVTTREVRDFQSAAVWRVGR